jgi:phage tail-like protein
MTPSGGHEAPVQFRFVVQIDGLAPAAFVECTGLGCYTDVVDYRPGTEGAAGRLPGMTHFPPLVLRRGLTGNRDLWEWRKLVIEGQPARRNGTVTLLAADGEPIARWSFRQGWPSRWEGPQLLAEGDAVALETIEVIHEGLDWIE